MYIVGRLAHEGARVNLSADDTPLYDARVPYSRRAVTVDITSVRFSAPRPDFQVAYVRQVERDHILTEFEQAPRIRLPDNKEYSSYSASLELGPGDRDNEYTCRLHRHSERMRSESCMALREDADVFETVLAVRYRFGGGEDHILLVEGAKFGWGAVEGVENTYCRFHGFDVNPVA